MPSDLRIDVLRDPARLTALVPQWDALAANALEPNPAYESWMLLPALRAFAAGQDVRIVAVWHGGELAGLFPLRFGRRCGGLVRTVSSWTHPHCVLCVPLVRANRAHEVLQRLFEWAGAEASVIELPYLAAEGAFHQVLVDVLHEEPRTAQTIEAYTRPLLRRARDAETYLATCTPSNERRELKRQEKRLAETGKLEHVALCAREDLARWIEEFLALEASGWKGKRGTAFGCSGHHRRFATEVLTGAFERGKLLMVGMNLDGRPIARFCVLTAGEGAIAFKTAFDERLRKYGPGTLVVRDVIGAFHERPELEWMDSYTGPNNQSLAALWKHRRTVRWVGVAADLRGEVALAFLPLLRVLRKIGGKLRTRRRAARTIPSLRPA